SCCSERDVTSASIFVTLSLHDALPIYSLDVVGDALKENLVENGWEVQVEQDSDNHGMKNAKKGDYGAVLGYREDKNDDDQTITRSEEHTSELHSREKFVCRLPLEKKKI